MKKVILMLSLALILSGCGAKTQTPASTDAGKGAEQTKQEDKSVFSSIKDAINRSITLRCDYTDKEGVNMIAYIKGKSIKIEGVQMTDADGKKENMNIFEVIKDDKAWVWTDKSDQGMLIDLKKAGESNLKMDEKPVKSTDDIIAKLEEKKDKCKYQSVPDSMFDVPKDKKFMDFSGIGTK